MGSSIHLVRKVHPIEWPGFQQLPVGTDKKSISLTQALLLRQLVLTFKFKWCHGQAQASTDLVGPAVQILSIYFINSKRYASMGDLYCPGIAKAHSSHFCFSEKVLLCRII